MDTTIASYRAAYAPVNPSPTTTPDPVAGSRWVLFNWPSLWAIPTRTIDEIQIERHFLKANSPTNQSTRQQATLAEFTTVRVTQNGFGFGLKAPMNSPPLNSCDSPIASLYWRITVSFALRSNEFRTTQQAIPCSLSRSGDIRRTRQARRPIFRVREINKPMLSPRKPGPRVRLG